MKKLISIILCAALALAALTACGLLAMSGFRLPERPDEAADRPAEHRSIPG